MTPPHRLLSIPSHGLLALVTLLCLLSNALARFKDTSFAAQKAGSSSPPPGIKVDPALAVRPGGSFFTTFNLSRGQLPAWQSKTPHVEEDAEAVFIITHGVDRNSAAYFSYLNLAYQIARGRPEEEVPYATDNTTLRIAINFRSEKNTAGLNATTLAWTDDNSWCYGESSLHPAGSKMSSLQVYDELVEKFSDKKKYPKVKLITFIGHGCGGIVTQHYAAIGRAPSKVSTPVRFVIANPSVMVYWTDDRPMPVTRETCDQFNTWYYGLEDYYISYGFDGDAARAFKQYVSRDVRYLVALNDQDESGDQTCAGQALGGVQRSQRSLTYWKYIHLLAGQDSSDLSTYPGDFDKASLMSKTQFHAPRVNHRIHTIKGIGHDAKGVIESDVAQREIFGP